MRIPHRRTGSSWQLQRSYEGSRLEAQLVAAAYELALPIRRQSLSRPHRLGTEETVNQPLPAHRQGVSA
jgi:hypothetical protein